MRGLDLFASLHNLFGFLAAGLLAALLSTAIAGLAVPAVGDWSQQGDALAWWGSDVTGTIVLAPALLSWLGRSAATRLRDLRRPEFVLLLLCCLAAGVLVNAGLVKVLTLRPYALAILLTLWSSLRFSPPAATLANMAMALVMALVPDRDSQLLPLSRSLESQELLELGVSISLLASLVVLVVSYNRVRTSRQLAQVAGSLERTVAERTQQLAAANAQLRLLSETDGLTGLTNRRRFDELLRQRWREAGRGGTPLAVAMIDIDHFKTYNDHYGHQAGDRCLQQVAAALDAVIRHGTDCLARYGGEEFVVLLPGLNTGQASALAERLRQRVSALTLPHQASPVSDQVTLSIGVAATAVAVTAGSAPVDEIQHQIETLLQQADERLYRAKAAGRDRVVAS